MSVLDIRVQKLFLVTLILKVGASFLGWMLRDPWVLGFTVPLVFMSAYIVLGYYRRDNDVTDEKFADSCYYLGFIFTITSIIFSLFDLPNIGTRIQDIAVRFGAAMVSTVLGLGVRVYLVSFKKDVADAIKDAEDAVLDATRKFTEQLTIALERLRDFESQVGTAAKESVERVNMQVESLSKNHADKLAGFFEELTTKNQEAFTSALAEVKSASERLAQAVDGYSLGMRTNLTSIEAKVGAFADAVTDRLRTTTFPDEYFAERLKEPLTQLRESATAIASGIRASLQEINKSTTVLSAALKKLQDKAAATEGSLETILKLTQQQQSVLDAAKGQLSALEQLGATLSRFDETLAGTLASVAASNGLTSELSVRIAGIVSDGTETRRSLETALTGVADTLKAQLQSTNNVVSTLEAGAAVTRVAAQSLADKLDTSTAAAESASAAIAAAADASRSVAAKLDGVAAADMEAAQALGALGQQATAGRRRIDDVVEQLQVMVRQLVGLDAALRSQGAELRDALARLDGARGVALVPTSASGAAFGLPSNQPPLSLASDETLDGAHLPGSSGQGGQPMPSANAGSVLVAGASPSTAEQVSGVSSPPTDGADSRLTGSESAVTQTFPAERPAD